MLAHRVVNTVAEYIFNKFKGWGFDVQIETFYVLFPYSKNKSSGNDSPTQYKACLKRPPLKEDATSGQAEQLPTYNVSRPMAMLTAELVFVNYGVPEDYEMLERMGIDVKGKIVIAKYGHSWRGIKPKVAQEHGAIGVSFIPILRMMVISRVMFIRKAHLKMNMVCSVAL